MSKQMILTILLCIYTLNIGAKEMKWMTLSLTIHDIDVKRGGDMHVFVFLENGFPIKHDQAIKNYRFAVTRASQQLAIDVPAKTFALKAHHDEDRSGKVSKNWTGIFPSEGLGFSSGAKIFFGPPSFNNAAMSYPDSGSAHLYMIYP